MDYRIKDLTGKRFGKLLVVSLNGSGKYRRAMWLCKCDCGNDFVTAGQNLTQGGTISCGCYHSEEASKRNAGKPIKILPNGEAAFNSLYGRYKFRANKKKFEFNLTKEEFKNLTEQKCYYCGEVPKRCVPNHYNTGTFIYNGIDRLDNSKGYTLENSVACCAHCNIMKNSFSIKEFKEKIEKIYSNFVVGNK